jgi:hypothetical protein
MSHRQVHLVDDNCIGKHLRDGKTLPRRNLRCHPPGNRASIVDDGIHSEVRIGLPDRQNVGILWETSCNNVGNSEQNEQMKKRPSVRANHV